MIITVLVNMDGLERIVHKVKPVHIFILLI